MCEIDRQRLPPCPIKCGVPQGWILGPILFLLYFNDFENCLKRSKVINFADDTVVFLPGKTHLLIKKGLSFDLVNISNYFGENELVINLNQERQNQCYLLRVEG